MQGCATGEGKSALTLAPRLLPHAGTLLSIASELTAALLQPPTTCDTGRPAGLGTGNQPPGPKPLQSPPRSSSVSCPEFSATSTRSMGSAHLPTAWGHLPHPRAPT